MFQASGSLYPICFFNSTEFRPLFQMKYNGCNYLIKDITGAIFYTWMVFGQPKLYRENSLQLSEDAVYPQQGLAFAEKCMWFHLRKGRWCHG